MTIKNGHTDHRRIVLERLALSVAHYISTPIKSIDGPQLFEKIVTDLEWLDGNGRGFEFIDAPEFVTEDTIERMMRCILACNGLPSEMLQNETIGKIVGAAIEMVKQAHDLPSELRDLMRSANLDAAIRFWTAVAQLEMLLPRQESTNSDSEEEHEDRPSVALSSAA